MARELEGKVAAITGAASGIGLASAEAMLAAGARVVLVDRDEAALQGLVGKHGDAVIPLVIDLLNPADCATLLPQVLGKAGRLDIFHANAGSYVGANWSMPTTRAVTEVRMVAGAGFGLWRTAGFRLAKPTIGRASSA